jgi:hypothetical protein
VINRPGLFSRKILEKPSFFDMFAGEIPETFLTFIRRNPSIPSVMLSFHPHGVVCYIPDASREAGNIEDDLQKTYGYAPFRQTRDGVRYSYYPVSEKLFLGCCIRDGIWVGSLSRKLLEDTSAQTGGNDAFLSPEIIRLTGDFDVNAPLNVLFPAISLNLRSGQGAAGRQGFEGRWMAADLFVSEGDFCCFGKLPYHPDIPPAIYREIGDTVARQIETRYPQVSLSFQILREKEFVYYTGCTPMPER